MYNPKTSASRRLRVLALAPAFAAAVLVTDIPAVAGAIDSASGASLSAVMPAEAVAAVTESKVTKNTSAGQPGLSAGRMLPWHPRAIRRSGPKTWRR